MSQLIFNAESIREWPVVVECDGVRIEFTVRRRLGEQHDGENTRTIESFELWRDDQIKGQFVLPADGNRRSAKEAAMRTLARVLDCESVSIESDGDSADALFGPDR
jgi:hypothetical protein